MRVGYLNQPWDSGIPPDPGESIGIWSWEIARCLARTGEVIVCARRRRGEPATGTWERVRYIRLPLMPSRADRWLSVAARQFYRFRDARQPRFASDMHHLAYVIRAALAFRANECDVVHIHNFSQFVPVVRKLNPQARIVLHMNCDWLAQLDRRMIDRRLRHADAIFGCSEYVTANVRVRFPHHANRCMTVFNGVNPKEFHPNGRKPSASPERRVIFIGRISPEKGLHVLIDAFERVAALRSDTSLEIIGPEFVAPMEFVVALSDDRAVRGLSRFYKSSYLEYLRIRARGPLEGRVSFASALPHSQVVERLRSADICVVPSVWSEPFGMPAVEAMASGLPVVASRGGGLAEIVREGETGLLVEPDNPSALAEALSRLLDNPALARTMGQAGRQRAERMFCWESIAGILERVYTALCSGAPICNGDRNIK